MTAETQPERVRWHTQSLRMTAFIEAPGASMLVRDWWNVVAGAPPVHVVENPLEGSVEVLGVYADGPLRMKAQRDRLDIMRPLAPPNAEVETFPHLNEVIPSFVEATARWLDWDARPALLRLGLGATSVRLFSDLDACRSALDGYLPTVDMQRTAPENFMFQVNRQCGSEAIPDLTINRVGRWEWARPTAPNGAPCYGIGLELDLNSEADRADPLDNPAALLSELAGHAVRLATEGDHP